MVEDMIKRSIILIVLTGVMGCASSPPLEKEEILPGLKRLKHPKISINRVRFAVKTLERLDSDFPSHYLHHSDLDSLVYSYKGMTQFRGNPTHTFYGTGEIPEQEPGILWSFRTGQIFSKTLATPWEGLGWTGQPAVSVETNGTFVYVASLDGHVYKLDFETGQEILKTETNFNIIKSSPAVTDKYLIFGSWDNRVHILDKQTFALLHTEEAIYTPSASYDFDSSPVVEEDHFYIGGEDGYIRKISLQPPFKREWLFPDSPPQSEFTYGRSQKPYVGIESTVAIAGDKLIAGTGNGKVLILNKHNGDLLAQFESGDDTDSSPVVDLSDSSFYIGVEKDFSENDGGLYKLSLAGEVKWFFPTGRNGVFSTPAIDSSRVIVTGDDGYLYSLDKQSGELQWKRRLLDGSWSSPILIRNRMIAADYAGYLYGIDAFSGKILWKKKLGNYIVASPVLWQGTILVGTRDGFVYALKVIE
jgi:outer membrane protein assembly factor BamB